MPIKMARLETSVRAVIRVVDAFSRQSISEILDQMRPDVCLRSFTQDPHHDLEGRQAVEMKLKDLFDVYPDLSLETEDIHGLGDRGEVQWKVHFLDADGRQQVLQGVALFRFREEKIAQVYLYIRIPGALEN